MVLAALHAALVFICPSISPLKSWGTWAWVGFGSWTAWSSQVPSSSGYFLILWLIFLFFLPWRGRRFPLKHSLSTCFLLVGKKNLEDWQISWWEGKEQDLWLRLRESLVRFVLLITTSPDSELPHLVGRRQVLSNSSSTMCQTLCSIFSTPWPRTKVKILGMPGKVNK